MIVTRKAIPRRTLLRGLGAAVALPLLDGMAPALTALSRSAARPVRRFGVVYVPNGVVIDQWTPATTGAGFEFTPILKPLEPFRDRLQVLTGLTQNVNGLTAGSGAVHGRCATKYLTGAIPRPFGQEGNDFLADVSLDQLVARQLGQDTALGSLELSLESGDKGAGTCDGGYSCTYSHTITWRGPRTPLPMEHNPRVVFERMFGDGGSTDPAVRQARLAQNRSLLDSVGEKAADLRARPRAERRRQAHGVSRRGAGHRAAHPACRGAGCARVAGVRPAARRARELRGPRAVDVRPAGARLPERPDTGHHVHGGPGVLQPHLPGDRCARRSPPAVARGQLHQSRAVDPHQHAPRGTVLLLSGPAGRDPSMATARCWTTSSSTTGRACPRAITSRGTCRWWWPAVVRVG